MAKAPPKTNDSGLNFEARLWVGENLRQDVRWKFEMPPENNANYAWIQHFIHNLSPVGVAGFVLANGSMSTETSNEGEIRKALIEADLVDCMVALPGQLFFTTQNPVCSAPCTRVKHRLAVTNRFRQACPVCSKMNPFQATKACEECDA
jgi:hypothetical protein